MRFELAAALLAVVGASAVGAALPRADATRQARLLDQVGLIVPDAEQTRAAATGFEEPLADLLWVRAVLFFADEFSAADNTAWVPALHGVVDAVITLDPAWRTAPFYGGTLLRLLGDIDASEAVFRRGAENLPNDPYFPFSLGMSAYLNRDDPEAASVHLAQAAAIPGAPPWYAAAAAAMQQKAGQRGAGIRYLRELRDSTSDPAIRADAERQLARLYHNEIVDQWDEACVAWRDEHGPLPSPEAITQLGFALPPNPRGDAWIVAADGVVRSAAADQERVRNLRGDEWMIIGR